jgi:hypothetical protein
VRAGGKLLAVKPPAGLRGVRSASLASYAHSFQAKGAIGGRVVYCAVKPALILAMRFRCLPCNAVERGCRWRQVPGAPRLSSFALRRRHGRETAGTRCVTVDVNQGEVDALVVRGYLSEEERDNGAAIKKAIEGVISDMVFELESETAERRRGRA